MLEMRYAEFAEHKDAHEKLIGEVLEMQKKFMSGETKMTVDLLKFLFDWLFEHIMKIDKKLAQAIRAGQPAV